MPIFLFLKLFPNILWTLFVSKFTLSWLDLITDFTIDKFVLNFSAAETRPFVSLGKQDPPYAGPALKNLLPILESEPIPKATSSTSIPDFSHRLANSFIKVILVARKAFAAYLINSAPLLDVVKNLAPLLIKGE